MQNTSVYTFTFPSTEGVPLLLDGGLLNDFEDLPSSSLTAFV